MTPPQDFIAELEQAASRGPSQRSATLRQVTGLFVARAAEFTEEQIELFDVVLTRLIEVIEQAALVELAGRLAVVPNAPRRAIYKLAFADDIAVAGPVLTHSERLDQAALIRNALTKSQDHLLAISRRKEVPQVLTDVLLGRGDAIVVRSTAANHGARLTDRGYEALIRRSAADDQLALVVAARPELPRHLFLRLVAAASATVRGRLQALNPQASGEIRTVVDRVAARVRTKLEAHGRDYTAAQAAVAALRAEARLVEREVQAFALAGRGEEVTASLAALGELPIEVVEHAMVQDRPETVLILTKAIGFAWPTVKDILKTRSRAISPYELDHAMASFERLTVATAQQILTFHRDRAARRRPS